jgi:hypothetical protein
MSLFCQLISASAQEQPPTIQKSYTDSEGKLYWNKDKPVYLRVSETPEGHGHLLKSKVSEKYTNPMYLDTEGLNYIRSNYAVDPVTRKPIKPQEEILFEIYADGEAPIAELSLKKAKRHRTNDITYYGPELILDLTATDKQSGTEQIFYAINNQEFAAYDAEIPMSKEGTYTVRYYAVDHVGNRGDVAKKSFVIDLKAPVSYYNINGMTDDRIIGASSKIYITSEDGSSGVKTTYYKFDDESYKTYQGREISFNYLEDGQHTLSFYSKDKVGNIEKEQHLEFYFDKSAPIVAADILGDRFIANDIVYFSGKTKMKLTAVDNKSGVKDILFAINSDEFKSYEEPFYLPNQTGVHTVRYYSLDNMANNSQSSEEAMAQLYKHKVQKIYVDLTGPSLKYSFVGPSMKARNHTYISPRTNIKFTAKDEVSGLQYITYSIDGAMDELLYDAAFKITDAGYHKIELFGYDNVNNRNVDVFEFIVDDVPPQIIANFSDVATTVNDGVSIYPSYTRLYLAAIDQETGVEKIYYAVNGRPKKLYNGIIQGFKKGKKYTIDVYAYDNLGNESQKTIEFKIEKERIAAK